jgi:hypothetical protein
VSHARYIVNDALSALRAMPDDSVDLVLTSPPFLALRGYLPADHPLKSRELGQETTPGEYIDGLMEVIEAIDRVLAPHGTLCVELGDTYSGSGGGGGDYQAGGWRAGQGTAPETGSGSRSRAARGAWPLTKSVTMIPELFRVTLAYGQNPLTGRQTAPWRVRNVVRWWRPNPMPSILSDKYRPATSDLAIACKGTRRYFDATAALTETGAPQQDTWRLPTKGTTEAHYAIFPGELCVIPIKTMCPERICTQCGLPSERLIEVEYEAQRDPDTQKQEDRVKKFEESGDVHPSAQGMKHGRAVKKVITVGWSDCGHDSWRRGLVLDPFAGTFTVGAVAVGHGRDAIGIELDERNVELAERRVGTMFLTVERPT